MATPLAHRTILMVVAPSGFRDEELFVPKQIFEAAGATVEIASTVRGTARGMLGGLVEPDLTVASARPEGYAAIVIAGGIGSPEHLWESAPLRALVSVAHEVGTPVAAICLSPAVLARAGLLRGRRATVYDDVRARHELTAGGAQYVPEPVVVDGNVVTATGPRDAEAFAKAVVRVLVGNVEG